MLLRPFLNDATSCASYLFGCGTQAKLAVVDPHAEWGKIVPRLFLITSRQRMSFCLYVADSESPPSARAAQALLVMSPASAAEDQSQDSGEDDPAVDAPHFAKAAGTGRHVRTARSTWDRCCA